MLFSEYRELVSKINLGKQLPNAVYLHKSALDVLSENLTIFIISKTKQHKIEEKWNVVKLFRKDFKISFLSYPDFIEDSYPALKMSYTIDLERDTVRKSNYADSKNPPILHRKETFLKPDHPDYHTFKEITKEGEAAGLYENVRSIGFKQAWDRLIKSKGLKLIDGRLFQNNKNVPTDSPSMDTTPIHRHLTAIDRNSLSTPMQSLFRHNYFESKYTILDFGCGKGDDIRILADHGIEATGWDPVYYPENKLKSKDIVNLGFVINVIEDINERNKTLQKAFKLTKQFLVVSAMLGGESIESNFQKHGDGVVTSRNTFQKYYSQRELRSYIEDVLQESAIAVGPGIFYVFKDKLEEQNFLVERERVKRNWQKLSYSIHPEKLKIRQRALYERHKELFEDYWTLCLDLGRVPVNTEFEFTERLRVVCGSHDKAYRLLIALHGDELYKEASNARRDDLLVYFALELFGRRKPYYAMPDGLKRDVKSFFASYRDAKEEAKILLFSAGKSENIMMACNEWYKKNKIGQLNDGHSLIIHSALIDQLPAILRIYVGCATQLYGDIDSVDLIKIHMTSGKVSLMRYDNFDGKPLPLLMQRIKIKLRQQDVDFFDYGSKYDPQPLYIKSQYISQNFRNYKKQKAFDEKLKTLKEFNLGGFGPSLHDFNKILESNLMEIRRFSLHKVT